MIKPQSFLGRVTTFVMSVLLISTFFFPLISQPAWADQPICTAESKGLGKSECNVNFDSHDTINVSFDNIDSPHYNTYNNSGSPETLLGGAVLGAVGGGVASVAAVSGAGSVAGLSAAGISSGLAAVGGVVGGGMAAGLAVSTALPILTTVGVGLAASQVVKAFFPSSDKQKADRQE